VRRPLPVLAMVAALGVLVVPHVVRSLDATGSILGILQASAAMPRRAYVGEGLVTYLTSDPFLFYGFLAAPVMVAGVAGLFRARRKAPWFLAIVALGQLALLGINTHGQPRYVFAATALLVVLGVDILARHRLARPRLALGLVATSWLGVLVAAPIYYHHIDDARAPLIAASDALRADSAGRPCAVIALIVPQLMWYSPCEVYASGLLGEPLPADRVRYAASFTSWPIDVAALLTAEHLEAAPVATRDPRAELWRLH